MRSLALGGLSHPSESLCHPSMRIEPYSYRGLGWETADTYLSRVTKRCTWKSERVDARASECTAHMVNCNAGYTPSRGSVALRPSHMAQAEAATVHAQTQRRCVGTTLQTCDDDTSLDREKGGAEYIKGNVDSTARDVSPKKLSTRKRKQIQEKKGKVQLQPGRTVDGDTDMGVEWCAMRCHATATSSTRPDRIPLASPVR